MHVLACNRPGNSITPSHAADLATRATLCMQLCCRNVAVAALPCIEKDGFVWIWPGEAEPSEVCEGGVVWSGAGALARQPAAAE